MKKIPTLVLLKTASRLVLLIGTAVSLFLVIHAGHKNASVILPLLFVIWVLSPYIGLLITIRISKVWQASSRTILHYLVISFTICCVIAYSGILTPSDVKPAAIFLITPLLLWVAIAITIPVLRSHKAK
jgi:uncharacterized membrane protein